MKATSTLYILAVIVSLYSIHPAHGLTFFGNNKPATVPADQSRIIVTMHLRLLEIDSEKYATNLLNSGDTVVDVPPGYHEFTVRYDKIWDIDYDNFDLLKSDPVTVSIAMEGTS